MILNGFIKDSKPSFNSIVDVVNVSKDATTITAIILKKIKPPRMGPGNGNFKISLIIKIKY